MTFHDSLKVIYYKNLLNFVMKIETRGTRDSLCECQRTFSRVFNAKVYLFFCWRLIYSSHGSFLGHQSLLSDMSEKKKFGM